MEVRVARLVVVSSVGLVVAIDVADTFETTVTVIWGGTVYPSTSVHQKVSLFW